MICWLGPTLCLLLRSVRLKHVSAKSSRQNVFKLNTARLVHLRAWALHDTTLWVFQDAGGGRGDGRQLIVSLVVSLTPEHAWQKPLCSRQQAPCVLATAEHKCHSAQAPG